jgi:hypothetical protein
MLLAAAECGELEDVDGDGVNALRIPPYIVCREVELPDPGTSVLNGHHFREQGPRRAFWIISKSPFSNF